MIVDIILPVYNQSFSLHMTLQGFSWQETEAYLHLIVVDDGSDEPVAPVLEQFSHLDITYIRQENKGRAQARNAAIPHLKGRYLILNDSDRIPHPHFVQAHLHRLQQGEKVVSIGVPKDIYFSVPEENRERILQIAKTNQRVAREPLFSRIVDVLYDQEGAVQSQLPWISTFSGNMALLRDAFEVVGGFDEGFTTWGFEHFELGYRLHQQGNQFARERAAVNFHLAHPRPADHYVKSILESHAYFASKHEARDVQLLKDFMLGDLSLQDYELAVAGTVQYDVQTPLFNKIF